MEEVFQLPRGIWIWESPIVWVLEAIHLLYYVGLCFVDLGRKKVPGDSGKDDLSVASKMGHKLHHCRAGKHKCSKYR